MTNYIKKFSAKVKRRYIIRAILLFLLTAAVGVVLLYAILPIGTFGKDFQNISDAKGRSFKLTISVDNIEYDLVEEKENNPDYLLFLTMANGEEINLITSEKKVDELIANGSLTLTVSRLSGDDNSSYAESVRDVARSESESDWKSYFQSRANTRFYGSTFRSAYLIVIGLGLFFLIMAIVNIVNYFKKASNMGELGRDIDTISEQMHLPKDEVIRLVNEKLNSNELVFKNKQFMFTRDWILAIDEQVARLIPTNYLAWLYRHTLTQRYYGIPVKKTHSIMMYSLTSKLGCKVMLKNEKEADQIFVTLQSLSPKAYVGYDQNLNNIVTKDYPAFLAMWYKDAQENNTDEGRPENSNETPENNNFVSAEDPSKHDQSTF